MDELDRAGEIRDVANQVLNFKGQVDVERLIAEDNLRGAAIYALGAVQHCVHDGTIDDATARAMYAKLGIDEATRLKLLADHFGGAVAS